MMVAPSLLSELSGTKIINNPQFPAFIDMIHKFLTLRPGGVVDRGSLELYNAGRWLTSVEPFTAEQEKENSFVNPVEDYITLGSRRQLYAEGKLKGHTAWCIKDRELVTCFKNDLALATDGDSDKTQLRADKKERKKAAKKAKKRVRKAADADTAK
jgi:hypothetical protein